MRARHVLSLVDIDGDRVRRLVEAAVVFGRGGEVEKTLAGKIVGSFFRKTSTRTRTSFATGAMRLGASVLTFGPDDLQLSTGETLEDTGRVLANYLDALVIRTNDAVSEMRAIAAQNTMPVINAMSKEEHPTQALADLATIHEAFGQLEDVHVLYIGEGNNTAAALALALPRFPKTRLSIVTPPNYGLPAAVLQQAARYAEQSGAFLEHHHDLGKLPRHVDVVYTTRWLTMGVVHSDPNWMSAFRPYTVNQALMDRVSKPRGTIFLHDLPAMRGYEVENDVLDGPQSVAFRQAFHKMTAAMAVLDWSVNG
ncbi:ornithine carbamoyltransferase [Pendulispora albinea]|uniref:Ornithine carbamoyltransferase n=1 Tax=Pendulispora albinea TaxID=2741071 RepID=A0ABZ2MB71_9BACT